MHTAGFVDGSLHCTLGLRIVRENDGQALQFYDSHVRSDPISLVDCCNALEDFKLRRYSVFSVLLSCRRPSRGSCAQRHCPGLQRNTQGNNRIISALKFGNGACRCRVHHWQSLSANRRNSISHHSLADFRSIASPSLRNRFERKLDPVCLHFEAESHLTPLHPLDSCL